MPFADSLLSNPSIRQSLFYFFYDYRFVLLALKFYINGNTQYALLDVRLLLLITVLLRFILVVEGLVIFFLFRCVAHLILSDYHHVTNIINLCEVL